MDMYRGYVATISPDIIPVSNVQST